VIAGLEGSRPVPTFLSPILRNLFHQCDLPYQTRTMAEYVFAHLMAVPATQYFALNEFARTGELPSVVEARDHLLELVDPAVLVSSARRQYDEHPQHVSYRAAKLAYDAYAELDAASLVGEIAGSPIVLNAVNDVERKVDAVFYPPAQWRSSWPRVLVGFKRQAPILSVREQRRDNQSEAHWNFRWPTLECEWVGTVACFPRQVLADQLETLREQITALPRARTRI
jgi:hypothetical protein